MPYILRQGEADVICSVQLLLELGPDPDLEGYMRLLAQRTTHLRNWMRLLVAVNLLGLPAASVPTGLWSGLPLGVQVISARYREDLCLDAAEIIEAQRGLSTPIDPVI